MSGQQLRNPVWIGFDGEPITGRTPTRVFVYGPKMTSQQQGELVRHYNKFCEDNKLSLGQYQFRDRYLPDGTRFRMVSVNGVDTVYAWTSAGSKRFVEEVFLFIPTESNEGGVFVDWEGAMWKHYSRRPPPELVEPSNLPSHPGGCTWSSPLFLDALRQHLVLSWRGPSNRYKINNSGYFCGWATHVGILPAAESASTVFHTGDSSSVWINTRQKQLPVSKVIAAALHRPDPENNPQNVVLRVCSNNYPQGSIDRGFVVFDLVPEGLTDKSKSTLRGIYEAPLVVDGAFVPTNYNNSVSADKDSASIGDWEEFSRPHFDMNGERIAMTVAFKYDANTVVHAVRSIRIETWAVEEQYLGEQEFGVTASAFNVLDRTYGTNTGSYVTDSGDSSFSRLEQVGCADYDKENRFVYITKTTSQEEENENSSNFSYDEFQINASASHASSATITTVITHSVLGELSNTQRSLSLGLTGTCTAIDPDTVGSGTISVSWSDSGAEGVRFIADNLAGVIWVAEGKPRSMSFEETGTSKFHSLVYGDASMEFASPLEPISVAEDWNEKVMVDGVVSHTSETHISDVGYSFTLASSLSFYMLPDEGDPDPTPPTISTTLRLGAYSLDGNELAVGNLSTNASREVLYLGWAVDKETYDGKFIVKNDEDLYVEYSTPNYRAQQPFPILAGYAHTLQIPIFMPQLEVKTWETLL